MNDKDKLLHIIESQILVDCDREPELYFDYGFINHVIQYSAESPHDLTMEKRRGKSLRYRITIEEICDD